MIEGSSEVFLMTPRKTRKEPEHVNLPRRPFGGGRPDPRAAAHAARRTRGSVPARRYLSVAFSDEEKAEIVKVMGDVPFSTWVRNAALEKARNLCQ